MSSVYKNKCQVCKSVTKKIFSLGNLPPVNDYNSMKNLSELNYFNTDILFCKKCCLLQIGSIVDKEILFPKSYPYTSSTTKVLRENFKDLSEKVFKKRILNSKNDLTLDIGSNDGNLLSNFKGKCRVLGVTPENIGKLAIKRGIPTILDYFNLKTKNKILKKHGKCNLITATNVFAHIDEPNEILKNISKLLKKDGVFINESHYLIDLLKTNQYDTIYHEHLRYYSLTSLYFFLKKNKFNIFDCERIPTHGGSIRVYASKSKKFKVSKNVIKILKEEKKYLKQKYLKKFQSQILRSKLSLYKIIAKINEKNGKICGVSAPSRASTLINYVGLDESLIPYIFEIKGSYKIGNYMPGTKIEIISEEKIKKINPDYLLIFSWHIKEDLKKVFKKKGFKGKFIIPLPQPKIEA